MSLILKAAFCTALGWASKLQVSEAGGPQETSEPVVSEFLGANPKNAVHRQQ